MPPSGKKVRWTTNKPERRSSLPHETWARTVLDLPWAMDRHARLIGRLLEEAKGPEIDVGRVWYCSLGVASAWRVQSLLLFER
jgi:hypothetical protein